MPKPICHCENDFLRERERERGNSKRYKKEEEEIQQELSGKYEICTGNTSQTCDSSFSFEATYLQATRDYFISWSMKITSSISKIKTSIIRSFLIIVAFTNIFKRKNINLLSLYKLLLTVQF